MFSTSSSSIKPPTEPSVKGKAHSLNDAHKKKKSHGMQSSLLSHGECQSSSSAAPADASAPRKKKKDAGADAGDKKGKTARARDSPSLEELKEEIDRVKKRYKDLGGKSKQRSSIERAVNLYVLKFADVGTIRSIDFASSDINERLVRGAFDNDMLRNQLARTFPLDFDWTAESSLPAAPQLHVSSTSCSSLVSAHSEPTPNEPKRVAIVKQAAELLPLQDVAMICKCIAENRIAASEDAMQDKVAARVSEGLSQKEGELEAAKKQAAELQEKTKVDKAEIERLQQDVTRLNGALQTSDTDLRAARASLELEQNTARYDGKHERMSVCMHESLHCICHSPEHHAHEQTFTKKVHSLHRAAIRNNTDRFFVVIGHYSSSASASDGAGAGGVSIESIASSVHSSLARMSPNAPVMVVHNATDSANNDDDHAPAVHVQNSADSAGSNDDAVMSDAPTGNSASGSNSVPATVVVTCDENGVPVFGRA